MLIDQAPVVESRDVAENVRILRFRSPEIASTVQPGQFVNIKPDSSYDPLLRRAYSVHRTDGDVAEIIYNVHGKGSRIFAAKQPGDPLNVMGPLGQAFSRPDDLRMAVLVSGGLGIAPMPILGDRLASDGVEVVNIHGSRTASLIPDDGRLRNVRYATDDGSIGLRGTTIDGLRHFLESEEWPDDLQVYACGPNPMLSALSSFCRDRNLALEVSLECQMACGVGICQGCPVEMREGEFKYQLVCAHGPNFDSRSVVLDSLPVEHG
jgi:dihydroorotate dehydrogenase electron transfer subunit